MLEGFADLLANVLDLFLIGADSKKRRYHKIERIIEDWSKKVGLHQQYEYKDEKVCSINVVDDAGNTYQIYIETLKWGRLKIKATNNKSGRKRKFWSKKCKTSTLTKVLFETYGVIEQWIFESGNSRTIK